MKCLLDMDGVLVEFVEGALRHHGLPTNLFDDPNMKSVWDFVPHTGLSEQQFWKPLGYRFWSKLGWEEDGRVILALAESYFGEENVCLLTSPCNTKGCYDGKRQWVKNNIPRYYDRVIAGKAKEFCAGSSKQVLIDDSDLNVNKFSAAGGVGILVPRIWNSKHERRHESVKALDEQLDFLFEKTI